MPQLNFYNYLSQSTWLLIIFFSFHIYMKSYILPSIYEYFFLTNSNFSTKNNNYSISYFLPY